MDGHSIRIEQCCGLLLRALVIGPQGLDPRQLLATTERSTAFVDQLTQHHLSVADDANVHWPVAADLFVRNIDLEDLHILGKTWRQAKANDEVEPGTDDQHYVGLFPRLVARAEEAQGMVFGDHSPTLRSGVERDAAQLDELFQFLHRVRPEHAGTSKDNRPLGLLEQSDRSLDQLRVALNTGDSVRLFEELHLTLLH